MLAASHRPLTAPARVALALLATLLAALLAAPSARAGKPRPRPAPSGAAPAPSGAAPAPSGAAPAARKPASLLAVVRVEPLGLDAERALRLEMLFRHELERLAGAPMPSKGRVERILARTPALQGCTAEVACLTDIGRHLGVKLVVAGNVGEMGDSYVINLKLVDAETGKEVRRIQEPLRGSPDELIEAVRVAAYRLAAPDRLLGSIEILSDVAGAQVFVDGKGRGKTPLARPISGLTVGMHKLRITAPGYTDFIADAEVRFQKSTQVIVRMVAAIDPTSGRPMPTGPPRRPRTPWYSSTWGYVGVGVGAVALGVLVGLVLVPDEVVRCDDDPAACGLR